jgi:hypothetical protein
MRPDSAEYLDQAIVVFDVDTLNQAFRGLFRKKSLGASRAQRSKNLLALVLAQYRHHGTPQHAAGA